MGILSCKLSNKKFIYRIIELFMNKEAKLQILPLVIWYFYQQITFNKINGFSNIRIMEDISISKKLRRISKPFIIKKHVPFLLEMGKSWGSKNYFFNVVSTTSYFF